MVAGRNKDDVAKAEIALKKAKVKAYQKEVLCWKPVIKEVKQQLKGKVALNKLQKKIGGIIHKQIVSGNFHTV